MKNPANKRASKMPKRRAQEAVAAGLALAAGYCALLLTSPAFSSAPADAAATPAAVSQTPVAATPSPAGWRPAPPPLENLLRLSPAIFSGGEPKDDAALSRLAELGIRTVVSVDGIKPNVAAAAQHGLRYVHIPIGYDAVDAAAQGALTRLVREANGPVYIHCHHGKHRGPAAAAIACMAAGQMNREQAAAYLKQAGTGREYPGLWRDVDQFQPLPAGAPLPELVETAEVNSLAAAMAQLDRAWDGLKQVQAAGWQTPAGHADLAPEHQAQLVWEGFREAERANHYEDPQLTAWLRVATLQAAELRQSLQAGRPAAATAAFRQLEAGCAACHKPYRN